jgi:ribosome-binding ATPase YchF (GTP1/OBG family)
VARLRAYAAPVDVVPVAAKFEAELAELDDAEERAASWPRSGRTRPACRAWQRPRSGCSTSSSSSRSAPRRRAPGRSVAAGRPSRRRARSTPTSRAGFIRAEVIPWQELVTSGSHTEAAKRGVQRVEGRDYTVADGDVINVRFNV